MLTVHTRRHTLEVLLSPPRIHVLSRSHGLSKTLEDAGDDIPNPSMSTIKSHSLATALLARLWKLTAYSGKAARITRHTLMFTLSHTFRVWLLLWMLLSLPFLSPLNSISLKGSVAEM